jgi:hypothetical protein
MKLRRYVRRVAPRERYWLVINEIYSCLTNGVIEGVGHVDPVALQRAVTLAAAANPGIRVRLRGFLGFARWVDSGAAPRVRLLSRSDWDGTSEQNAEFLLERMDALRGSPIADVLIVPCSDGKIRLVFRTVHAAIDGRGVIHWMEEVVRAMRGESLRGSDSRLIDLDIQEQYKAKVPDEPPEPPVSFIPVLQPASSRNHKLAYVWRRLTLDRPVSQLLPKMAVFLAEWARLQQTGPVGFTIPIDYRGLRTDELGVGNLTGYLRLSVPEMATPRVFMQELTHKIRHFADCRGTPGMSKLYWFPIRRMVRALVPKIDALLYTTSPVLPSGGIVSMGNQTAEAASFPGFQATYSFGLPAAIGKLNIVFVNYPASVTIVFAAPSGYNDEGQLDALVTAVAARFGCIVRATEPQQFAEAT